MTHSWSIPATWQWAKIGEVATIVGGGTPKTSDPANFDGGKIPWITPADLSGYREKFIAHGARNITERGLRSSSARLIPTGAVLFSSRAPIGYLAIASQPVATNQGFKSFVLPDGIDCSYVYYYLLNSKELVEPLSSGTTFKEISAANTARIPFAVAPLPEQRRIVAEIEKQFTRLDASVAALRRAHANLKRYRASVLRAACSGELAPTEAELARSEGREYEPASVLLERILAERRAHWEAQEKRRGKYKEPAAPDTSDLPPLPEGWAWATVDTLIIEPLSNGRSVKTASDGFPVLRLTALQDGQIDQSEFKIGAWTPKEAERFLIREGDFFVSRGNGSIKLVGLGGVVGPVQAPVAYPDTLIRFRLHPDVILNFFAQVWNSAAIRQQLETIARTTAGIHKVNQQDLSLCVIPLPPTSEQRRIVAEVERRLSVIQQAGAAVEASLQRAERLRQSILKRAFSGELVPQDPDDEPASVLLERIRAQREAERAEAAATKKGPARRRRQNPTRKESAA